MTSQRLSQLYESHASGTLTEPERVELNALLRADGSARTEWAGWLAFDAALVAALANTAGATHESPLPIGGVPPISRRRFSWRLVAASVFGVAATGLTAVSASEAGRLRTENDRLNNSNRQLKETLATIEQLLGAFTLTGDSPDATAHGPGAVLSGTDVVTVAGHLDPAIIQRVLVVWDADGDQSVEEVLYPAAEAGVAPSTAIRFHPFSASRTFRVKPGKTISVKVRADANPDAGAVLRRLQRDGLGLERQAWFIGSEYGLVMRPKTDWLVTNLLPDAIIDDDFFPLEGVSFADGSLLVCHQSNDGVLHLVSAPIPLKRDARLSPQRLDFGAVSNGASQVRLLLVSDAVARAFETTRFDEPLAALPTALRERVVLVNVALSSVTLRAAKFVIGAGGAVKAHRSNTFVREPASIEPGSEIQTVELTNCRSVRSLERLRGLRLLQDLHCSGSGIGDAALGGLSDRHPQLLYVEFSDCHGITDRGVIDDICRCRRLQMLGLSSNPRITNDSVEAIAKHLPDLNYLSLRSTSVTSVSALKSLKKLTKLSVTGADIPAAELDELQTALRELVIER